MALGDDFLPAVVSEILEVGRDQLVDIGLREGSDNNVLKPRLFQANPSIVSPKSGSKVP